MVYVCDREIQNGVLMRNTGGLPLVRSPLVRFPLNSTNFVAIGIKLVLVEIGYVVLTSTNFA